MSLFCCYAKQDAVEPVFTNVLTQEEDNGTFEQKDNILETEVKEDTREISGREAEAKGDGNENPVLDNLPSEETESPPEELVFSASAEEEVEDEMSKSEYKPIVYDSVTNTMEEFIEPQSEK